MQPLIPTMWRTCRVLANSQRLHCLQHVCLHPGRNVSHIADATQQRVGVASQYLRDLQARGLIGVRRWSRWTFYDPVADPSVGHAAAILAATRAAICPAKPPYHDSVTAFAAFAHPRRLQIIRFLRANGMARLTEIVRNTGISERALLRHLQCLVDAGVVNVDQHRWRATVAPTPLLAVLMRETCR